MTKLPCRPKAKGRRAGALGAVALLVTGVLGVGALNATSASADTLVHAIVESTPESWAPNVASTSGHLHNQTPITISCYLTGDTVSGPYGSENVWDFVSGGSAPEVQAGTFVPDADVYTGSNSPVVPPCSMAHGVAIGGNQVPIYSGPGTDYGYVGPVNSGQQVEIECYSTGTWVSGPYGSENTWDLITPMYFAPQAWMPDALVYTGSNSAVVPHC